MTDRKDDCTTILSKRREPLVQNHNATSRRHLQPYRCGSLKYRIWISFWDARKGHETADRCARACVYARTSHDWQRNLSWWWCRMVILTEIFCFVCEVILFWSEVSYVEVLRDISNMYIRVTLYWLYCGYFIWCVSCTVVVLTCFVTWECMYGFCNVWVCVCVGFVMCGCVYIWVL